MNFLIITSIITISFINLYFIDEIFKIVEPPEVNIDEGYKTNSFYNTRVALISGDTDICIELSELLEQYNVSCLISNDIEQACHIYHYDYLIAVNKSDLDNLTICSIAIKAFGVSKVISVCNQYYNKKIYEENSIPYLFGNSFTASDIVYELLGHHKK